MDTACRCALRPSTEAVALATQAGCAVEAILSREATAEAPRPSRDKGPAAPRAPAPFAAPLAAPELLAEVAWRAAALLHSDCVSIYRLGVALLARVTGIAALDDPSLGEALGSAAPTFWAAARPAAPLEFGGLQPLLLKGVGRRATRDACLGLMRHAAACGPGATLVLEPEPTRLLSCVVALLPWLCECAATDRAAEPARQALAACRSLSSDGGEYACAAPPPAASSGSAGGVARGLADACGVSARRGRRDLLRLATVLHNYATAQYAEIAVDL